MGNLNDVYSLKNSGLSNYVDKTTMLKNLGGTIQKEVSTPVGAKAGDITFEVGKKSYTLNSEDLGYVKDIYKANFNNYYEVDDEDLRNKANGSMPRSFLASYKNTSTDQFLYNLGLPSSKHLETYLELVQLKKDAKSIYNQKLDYVDGFKKGIYTNLALAESKKGSSLTDDERDKIIYDALDNDSDAFSMFNVSSDITDVEALERKTGETEKNYRERVAKAKKTALKNATVVTDDDTSVSMTKSGAWTAKTKKDIQAESEFSFNYDDIINGYNNGGRQWAMAQSYTDSVFGTTTIGQIYDNTKNEQYNAINSRSSAKDYINSSSFDGDYVGLLNSVGNADSAKYVRQASIDALKDEKSLAKQKYKSGLYSEEEYNNKISELDAKIEEVKTTHDAIKKSYSTTAERYDSANTVYNNETPYGTMKNDMGYIDNRAENQKLFGVSEKAERYLETYKGNDYSEALSNFYAGGTNASKKEAEILKNYIIRKKLTVNGVKDDDAINTLEEYYNANILGTTINGKNMASEWYKATVDEDGSKSAVSQDDAYNYLIDNVYNGSDLSGASVTDAVKKLINKGASQKVVIDALQSFKSSDLFANDMTLMKYNDMLTQVDEEIKNLNEYYQSIYAPTIIARLKSEDYDYNDFQIDQVLNQLDFSVDKEQYAHDYFVYKNYADLLSDDEYEKFSKLSTEEQIATAETVWNNAGADYQNKYISSFIDTFDYNADISRSYSTQLAMQVAMPIPRAICTIGANALNFAEMITLGGGSYDENGNYSAKWEATNYMNDVSNKLNMFGKSANTGLTGDIISIGSDVATELVRMYAENVLGNALASGIDKIAGESSKAYSILTGGGNYKNGLTRMLRQSVTVKTLPFVANAAGGYWNEAKQSGATDAEATLYGLICGYLEGATEAMSTDTFLCKGFGGEKVVEKLSRSGKNIVTGSTLNRLNAIRFAASVLSEGVEEGTSYMGSLIASNLIYKTNGKSIGEKISAIGEEFSAEELLKEAGMGALIGLFGAASGTILNDSNASLAEALKATGFEPALVDATLANRAMFNMTDTQYSELVEKSSPRAVLNTNELKDVESQKAELWNQAQMANAQLEQTKANHEATINNLKADIESISTKLKKARSTKSQTALRQEYNAKKAQLDKEISDYKNGSQKWQDTASSQLAPIREKYNQLKDITDLHWVSYARMCELYAGTAVDKANNESTLLSATEALNQSGVSLDGMFDDANNFNTQNFDSLIYNLAVNEDVADISSKNIVEDDVVIEAEKEKINNARKGKKKKETATAEATATETAPQADATAEQNAPKTADATSSEATAETATETESSKQKKKVKVPKRILASEESIKKIQDIANKLNVPIVFYEEKNSTDDARNTDGMIYINKWQNAGNDGNMVIKTCQQIFGHELLHSLQGTHEFNMFRQALINYVSNGVDFTSSDGTVENVKVNWDVAVAKKMEEYNSIGKNISLMQADREVTAQLAEELLFTNDAFIDNLVKQNSNLAGQILVGIEYYINRIKARVAKGEASLLLLDAERKYAKAFKAHGKKPSEFLTQFSAFGGNGNHIATHTFDLSRVDDFLKNKNLIAPSFAVAKRSNAGIITSQFGGAVAVVDYSSIDPSVDRRNISFGMDASTSVIASGENRSNTSSYYEYIEPDTYNSFLDRVNSIFKKNYINVGSDYSNGYKNLINEYQKLQPDENGNVSSDSVYYGDKKRKEIAETFVNKFPEVVVSLFCEDNGITNPIENDIYGYNSGLYEEDFADILSQSENVESRTNRDENKIVFVARDSYDDSEPKELSATEYITDWFYKNYTNSFVANQRLSNTSYDGTKIVSDEDVANAMYDNDTNRRHWYDFEKTASSLNKFFSPEDYANEDEHLSDTYDSSSFYEDYKKAEQSYETLMNLFSEEERTTARNNLDKVINDANDRNDFSSKDEYQNYVIDNFIKLTRETIPSNNVSDLEISTFFNSFVNNIKGIKFPYREVKSYRVFDGSEIRGFALPSSATTEIRKLRDAGFYVAEYSKDDPNSLNRAVNEVATEKNTYFSTGDETFADMYKHGVDDESGFYYMSSRVLENINMDKIGVDSVESLLKGKNVKQQELDVLGLHAWLEELKSNGVKSVTKQELLDFINTNKVFPTEQKFSSDFKNGGTVPHGSEKFEKIKKLFVDNAIEYINNFSGITNGKIIPVSEYENMSEEQKNNYVKIIPTDFSDDVIGYVKKDIYGIGNYLTFSDIGGIGWMAKYLPELDDNDYSTIRMTQYGNYSFAQLKKLASIVDDSESDAKYNSGAFTIYDSWFMDSVKDIFGIDLRDNYDENGYSGKTIFDSYASPIFEVGGSDSIEGKYVEILHNYDGLEYNNKHWTGKYGGGYRSNAVIAHTRGQYLNIPSLGNVFFVDELQSDVHENGRKFGYKTENGSSSKIDYYYDSDFSVDEENKKMSDIDRKIVELRHKLYSGEKLSAGERENVELEKEHLYYNRVLIQNRIDEYDNFKWGAVPDVPFKTNWNEMLFKSVLKNAVDNNVDCVVFADGEINAKRYDFSFSKNIVGLEYNKLTHELKIDYASGVSNSIPIPFYSYYSAFYRGVKNASLSDIVGSSIANKLISDFSVATQRVDVEKGTPIGKGAPMSGFYDIGGTSSQNIPRFANKWCEKWGVQIEEVELDVIVGGEVKTLKLPALKINDAMRNDILNNGQTLFSAGGTFSEMYDADDGKLRKTVDSAIKNQNFSDEFRKSIANEVFNGKGTYVPVSNEEMLKQADEYIAVKGYNVAENDIANAVRRGMISPKLVAVAERLIKNYDEAGETVKATDVLFNLASVSTELGRSVQLLNKMKTLGAKGQAYYVTTLVNKLNQDYADRILSKHNKMQKITVSETNLNILSNAKTQAEINDALDKCFIEIGQQIEPTIREQLNTFRYTAMLANPVTHERNILGNILMAGMREAKNVVGTGIENLMVKSGKMSTDERSFSILNKNSDNYKDLKKSADDAWQEYKEFAKGETKFTNVQKVQKYARNFSSGLGVVGEGLNKASQFTTDTLELEDYIALDLNFKRAYMQMANARGLDVNNLTKDQRSALVAHAVEEAQKATYRDASVIANFLNRLARKNVVADIAISGTLPFKKTPINVVKRGIEYSPIGYVKAGLSKAFKGEYTASEFVDDISSATVGTALMGIGMLLSKLGILRGKDKDDEYETFLEQMGSQAYSMQIGDLNINLSQLAPATMPLFMGVSLMESIDNSSKSSDESSSILSNFLKGAVDATASIANPVTDLSLLSSVNEVLKAYGSSNDSFSQNIGATALTAGKNYVSQFFPTIVQKATQLFDPYKRTTKGFKADSPFNDATWDYYGKSIINKTPASFVLDPYVKLNGDVEENGPLSNFGEFVLETLNNWVLPAKVDIKNRDYVDEQIARLYEETGNNDIIPTYPNKYITVNGSRLDLTSDQYTLYSIEYGNAVYAAIKTVMNTEEYKNSDYATRADMVAEAKSNAGKTITDVWKARFAE